MLSMAIKDLIVKKLLKSVYIYGSYRRIKTGVSLFLDHPVELHESDAVRGCSKSIEIQTLCDCQGWDLNPTYRQVR